jgi:hypothetical protein
MYKAYKIKIKEEACKVAGGAWYPVLTVLQMKNQADISSKPILIKYIVPKHGTWTEEENGDVIFSKETEEYYEADIEQVRTRLTNVG